MKFKALEIENFRAISNVKLSGLKEVVLIAGSNGCGKSCIFDAIRLFKSMYGEYHQNELNSWFSEFQIGFNQNNYQVIANSLSSHVQDNSKPMRFYAELVLSHDEILWLKENIDFIVKYYHWRKKFPQSPLGSSIAEQSRYFQQLPKEVLHSESQQVLVELEKDYLIGEIILDSNNVLSILSSPLLEKLFSIYKPDSLGIMDHHSPQRNYSREQMNQINLNIETKQQNSSQHALYNTVEKYKNVKTELASSYIMNLLSKEANQHFELQFDINKTLEELFSNFFPDKVFLGPQPTKDGKLTFNVKTSYGSIHDIDGLSSGEKEILYGYLRIRNSAPKNSVLLIDEPELHLNPKLTQGLPLFYHRHLGRALNNQIWLVTHSDTLLRQAIGQEGFNIYHLQKTQNSDKMINQVTELSADNEIEQAVIDLVGDLAAYRPGAKLIIMEGGGNSDFDIRMIERLFPDFASQVNLVSSGSKKRVNNLHEILDKAKSKGLIKFKFYSIADADFDVEVGIQSQENRFIWDRFHIENYLLEPFFILKVIQILQPQNYSLATEKDVEKMLKDCASKTVRSLVRGQMEHKTNQKLVECIKTNIDRNSDEISQNLAIIIGDSIVRLNEKIKDELSPNSLSVMEENLRNKYSNDVLSDEWQKSFRGREILKDFRATYLVGITYEYFCNLIISKMRDENFQPLGMKKVLNEILSSS